MESEEMPNVPGKEASEQITYPNIAPAKSKPVKIFKFKLGSASAKRGRFADSVSF